MREDLQSHFTRWMLLGNLNIILATANKIKGNYIAMFLRNYGSYSERTFLSSALAGWRAPIFLVSR